MSKRHQRRPICAGERRRRRRRPELVEAWAVARARARRRGGRRGTEVIDGRRMAPARARCGARGGVASTARARRSPGATAEKAEEAEARGMRGAGGAASASSAQCPRAVRRAGRRTMPRKLGDGGAAQRRSPPRRAEPTAAIDAALALALGVRHRHRSSARPPPSSAHCARCAAPDGDAARSPCRPRAGRPASASAARRVCAATASSRPPARSVRAESARTRLLARHAARARIGGRRRRPRDLFVASQHRRYDSSRAAGAAPSIFAERGVPAPLPSQITTAAARAPARERARRRAARQLSSALCRSEAAAKPHDHAPSATGFVAAPPAPARRESRRGRPRCA